MMDYTFTSPPPKVEVKGKAIHRYVRIYRQTKLIGQTIGPSVLETTHSIELGFIKIIIQSYF